jgi:hypothetical protein
VPPLKLPCTRFDLWEVGWGSYLRLRGGCIWGFPPPDPPAEAWLIHLLLGAGCQDEEQVIMDSVLVEIEDWRQGRRLALYI